MPLPTTKDLPTETFTLGDTEYTITSLSRSQAIHLNEFGPNDEQVAEEFLIASAFGVDQTPAGEWLDRVDPVTADEVLDRILKMSGVLEIRRRGQAAADEAAAAPNA